MGCQKVKSRAITEIFVVCCIFFVLLVRRFLDSYIDPTFVDYRTVTVKWLQNCKLINTIDCEPQNLTYCRQKASCVCNYWLC